MSDVPQSARCRNSSTSTSVDSSITDKPLAQHFAARENPLEGIREEDADVGYREYQQGIEIDITHEQVGNV
ncbi:hypothetical protein PQX77_007682 [Marasmius sp. AFHP31]|nr:hypothetical protein PQX77_007682 [Marasmius sp. AFHP31]